MIFDAIISDDEVYRYTLMRKWGRGRTIVFICLNPSTADASVDDNTTRRLKNFARFYGYAGYELVNLYALRATNPVELRRHSDPEGPDNMMYLRDYTTKLKTIVFAWGSNHYDVNGVANRIKKLFPNALCLGHNKDGSPKHPLYLPSTTKLIRYDSCPIC